MQRISITHVSNAHNDWSRALDFYKQELDILKGRLTEIAGKNTGNEVEKQVDHFENQFDIQQQNIADLKQSIEENAANLGVLAKENTAGYVDGDFVKQHDELGKKYQAEEKNINELRHSFNRFAAEWM